MQDSVSSLGLDKIWQGRSCTDELTLTCYSANMIKGKVRKEKAELRVDPSQLIYFLSSLGQTPEEIRKLFNIQNDFTPEEEAQIKKENEWAEDR
jgi:hypothetical protein